MYYEEKLIDGVLMCRSIPGGELRPATGKVSEVVNRLAKMSEDERIDVFHYFCKYCGGFSPCSCENDD